MKGAPPLAPVIAFPEIPAFVIVIEEFTQIVVADTLKSAIGLAETTIGETVLVVVPHAFEACITA